MSYPALTLDLKCSTLHLKWLGWSKLQTGLSSMFQRLQGHLKEVEGVLGGDTDGGANG